MLFERRILVFLVNMMGIDENHCFLAGSLLCLLADKVVVSALSVP
jgi:hypothetical protein